MTFVIFGAFALNEGKGIWTYHYVKVWYEFVQFKDNFDSHLDVVP